MHQPNDFMTFPVQMSILWQSSIHSGAFRVQGFPRSSCCSWAQTSSSSGRGFSAWKQFSYTLPASFLFFFWNNLSELGGNELASHPPHPPAATQNFRSTGAGEENLRLSDARARRTRVRGSLSVKWPLSLRKSVSQYVMTRARVPAALQLELGWHARSSLVFSEPKHRSCEQSSGYVSLHFHAVQTKAVCALWNGLGPTTKRRVLGCYARATVGGGGRGAFQPLPEILDRGGCLQARRTQVPGFTEPWGGRRHRQEAARGERQTHEHNLTRATRSVHAQNKSIIDIANKEKSGAHSRTRA